MASKNKIVFDTFQQQTWYLASNSPFFLWDHARWDVCEPYFSEKDDSLKTNRQQPLKNAKQIEITDNLWLVPAIKWFYLLINSFLISNTLKCEMKQNIEEFHMQTFLRRKRFEELFLLIFLREYCCHVKMRECSEIILL